MNTANKLKPTTGSKSSNASGVVSRCVGRAQFAGFEVSQEELDVSYREFVLGVNHLRRVNGLSVEEGVRTYCYPFIGSEQDRVAYYKANGSASV
jgi:hypothetical protein